MRLNFSALAALALATAGCHDRQLESQHSEPLLSESDEQAGEIQSDLYVVRLADAPLASYLGTVPGLAPTNPAARGELRLSPSSPDSLAYLQYLDASHDAFEAAVEAALGRDVNFAFKYRYAFNGVALALTDAEAAKVSALPGVAHVQAPFVRHILSDVGPAWIGAPEMWSGAATDGPGTRGEGIVVGVIDTGINHDHPSFADLSGDGYDHDNPRDTFYGLCDPIAGAPFCNDKLIGVWDFTGTGPGDEHGHGSHTASTAAGNVDTAVISAPTTTLERAISGVAPRANLITYKGCTAAGSCVGASLVAAIDQATADGVDVVNYSIGGGPTEPWSDSDSLAFLGARDAGVFVATSAGNSGPGAATVGSPANAPWVTSVAASTHNRQFISAVADMSGGAAAPPADIAGKSVSSGYGPAPIVHARDFGDGQCLNPFPPGTFSGEIVICDRGTIPRVEKGRNVLLGGAGGLVLANTDLEGESTVADAHELPAVHIGYSAAQVLDAWVSQGDGHTATIVGTTADEDPANGDVMAAFSSRGYNAPAPDLVKPDVTAPGVDILAAVATPGEYGTMSGTSMSSPHMAGAAALVRAARPDWTPSEVKSAIMLTAKTDGVRKEDGVTASDPFDRGAGRVDLTRAALTGLVLDESTAAFQAADPSAGGDPSVLNLASLGDASCKGDCTWRRTLKSVASTDTRWTATAVAPAGMELTVRFNTKKNRVKLAPGESVELTVTADVSDLPVGEWVFAEVILTEQRGRAPAAHLPVAVLPGGAPVDVAITAPASSGAHDVTLTAPVDITDLTATVYGLERGLVTDEIVAQDPTPLDPYDGVGGTFHVMTEVEAGSQFLAAKILETSSTDLDLFIGLDTDGDGQPDASEEVCRSASETAFEACRVEDLEPGTYWIMVQNWLTGQAVDTVQLLVATVPGTDKGNLVTVGPGSVDNGEEFVITLEWNEPAMEPGTNWFGLVKLHSSATSQADVGSLFVSIERE